MERKLLPPYHLQDTAGYSYTFPEIFWDGKSRCMICAACSHLRIKYFVTRGLLLTSKSANVPLHISFCKWRILFLAESKPERVHVDLALAWRENRNDFQLHGIASRHSLIRHMLHDSPSYFGFYLLTYLTLPYTQFCFDRCFFSMIYCSEET